jgi:DNA-binding transcriptional ArsR family regulator
MDRNFINIDLEDPRAVLVAEALSNKTCVKILSLLAEHELTASDVASRLNIPLNTVGYNIDKLIHAGLIEKSSNYFWSVKGKKTIVYKVVNKRIIITPKKFYKGFIPAIVATGIIALALRSFINSRTLFVDNKLALPATESASAISSNVSLLNLGWAWFIAGAMFSLIVAFLWDWLSYKGILK